MAHAFYLVHNTSLKNIDYTVKLYTLTHDFLQKLNLEHWLRSDITINANMGEELFIDYTLLIDSSTYHILFYL